MFDIIGDIHGQAERLTNLLIKLGYRATDQGYRHSERKVIFVGDLIDRGAYQLETLAIVKDMVDNHNALIIMGNHEFNAIGWATPNQQQPDTFLRKHNDVHQKQHQIFLQQLNENSPQYHYWIDWFKSLPLFIDLGVIRVIHACWDDDIIEKIKPYLDEHNRLLATAIQSAFDPSHPLFDYCEILLKGKEIALPEGIYYHDKEGTRRHRTRIRWWLDHAETLDELCLIPETEKFPELARKIQYDQVTYHDKKPVFIGHYWLSGRPMIQSPYVACVDYSAALAGGKLVAYRWQGETILTNDHFVY